MVKIKPLTISKRKTLNIIAKAAVGTVLLGGALLSSCGGSRDNRSVDSTKGVITYMTEVDTNEFKIIHEQVVTRKEDSKIITANLDGTMDTMSLDKARVMDTTTTRGRSYRSVFYGGMFGYVIGRSFSSPLNRNSYSNTSSYNNSTTRRTSSYRPSVTRPSSGYGSSKSFRSFGG